MKRFFTTFCAVLALAGALIVVQEAWGQDNTQGNGALPPYRFRRLNGPQKPTDSSPDPPPVPQPAPVAQPRAQPVNAQQAAAGQAQPAPPVADPPQPPENLPPPTAAEVTYRNGLLTVQATNSTLGGLLNAIRNKTGIQFEGLEGSASERVAISMGPSPEGEVLASILAGSKYDYIVVERPDSPGIVQRVLLSPRAGSTPTTAGATQPPAPALSNQGDDDDSGGDEAETPQDTPVRPPVSQVQPQPQQQQQQSQPKTPEQLLEELRRMQQQAQPQTGQPAAPIKPPPQ